ncbi:ankyrin repeat domain-containing protein [Aspergillus undulatus]|uniref:ankyrin repeat domain-containing protein n=1 Tax=Aspergillus undulatus TaxID=1810928 RepID=UPI003CCD88EA
MALRLYIKLLSAGILTLFSFFWIRVQMSQPPLIQGFTPLEFAAEHGHCEVFELLLDRGAKVSRVTSRGWVPLFLACLNGHAKVAQVLIKAGADVDQASPFGVAPLHVGFQSQHEGVVYALIANSAPLESLDSCGITPWQYATPVFRAKIPKCRDCKAPSVYDQQRRQRQTIQKIAQATNPSERKSMESLDCLGHCLVRLQDFAAASLVFSQTVKVSVEDHAVGHWEACYCCHENLSLGSWYVCTTRPRLELCPFCMEGYAEGGVYECVGHELLQIPSHDRKPEDQTDVYTEGFVSWLKELALRYEDEDLKLPHAEPLQSTVE